jgi:hypothetical protein
MVEFLRKVWWFMARVFSPGGDGVIVEVVALDMAPGRPSIVEAGYVVDGDFAGIRGKMRLPKNDFGGPVLTGLDDAYVTAAEADLNGTFPNNVLGGAEAVASFGRFEVAVTEAQAMADELIPFEFSQPALPGGAAFNLVPFVSDNRG